MAVHIGFQIACAAGMEDTAYHRGSMISENWAENGTLDARQLISNAGLRTQTCGIGFLKLLVIVRDMTIIGKGHRS